MKLRFLACVLTLSFVNSFVRVGSAAAESLSTVDSPRLTTIVTTAVSSTLELKAELPVAPRPRDKQQREELEEQYPYLTEDEIKDIQLYGGLRDTCKGVARCCNGDEYTISYGCILIPTYLHPGGQFRGYMDVAPLGIWLEASKAICAEAGGASRFTAVGHNSGAYTDLLNLNAISGGRYEDLKCPNAASEKLSTNNGDRFTAVNASALPADTSVTDDATSFDDLSASLSTLW